MGYRKAVLKRLDSLRWRYIPDGPASVARAAKYLRLDPLDAERKERLLQMLAEAIFGSAKKGRRKGATYWHKIRLFELGRLYSIEKDENPKLKDAAIARRITKHRAFKNDDPDRIRQLLPGAYELYQERLSAEMMDLAAEFAAEHPELVDRESDF